VSAIHDPSSHAQANSVTQQLRETTTKVKGIDAKDHTSRHSFPTKNPSNLIPFNQKTMQHGSKTTDFCCLTRLCVAVFTRNIIYIASRDKTTNQMQDLPWVNP
jgi:hypothetical protein